MMWQVAVLLLLTLRTSVNSQGCSLPTLANINDIVEDSVESRLGDGGSNIVVDLHHYTLTCLASGGARDVYDWMAVAANFTFSGNVHREIFSTRYI